MTRSIFINSAVITGVHSLTKRVCPCLQSEVKGLLIHWGWFCVAIGVIYKSVIQVMVHQESFIPDLGCHCVH